MERVILKIMQDCKRMTSLWGVLGGFKGFFSISFDCLLKWSELGWSLWKPKKEHANSGNGLSQAKGDVGMQLRCEFRVLNTLCPEDANISCTMYVQTRVGGMKTSRVNQHRAGLISTDLLSAFLKGLFTLIALAVYTAETWKEKTSPQLQVSFAWSFYSGWITFPLFLLAGESTAVFSETPPL